MNFALASVLVPLMVALVLFFSRSRNGWWVMGSSLVSLVLAAGALHEVVNGGSQWLNIGGWDTPLAIRFQLMPVSALLLVFTALIHLLVAVYAQYSRHSQTKKTDFWPLTSLLHASLGALWLTNDLFNWYITLELLGLVAVAMVTLSGAKAYGAALRYLLLSLVASLFYLLGVAVLYGRFGVLDLTVLAQMSEPDPANRLGLILMTLGLMLKAACWPLHLWLPAAHAGAPTAVSALLSALVVKGPLFILWRLWSQLAPVELAIPAGLGLACAGILALVCGGWSALRAPYIKTMVAYSTVAQLGYALLALGLMLRWQKPELHVALWLFVLAHGLAKTSMFMAAGEMQGALHSRRVGALRGATQTMPVAMFAFAVAGGSLIGLPPSGGFLAKWVLLRPLVLEPAHWPWAAGVLLGTLVSAAYVFRVVALAFDRASPSAIKHHDSFAQWLALLPAVLVWGMALISHTLILWLTGVTG